MKISNHSINLVFLVLILSFIFVSSAQQQVYVVYLGHHNGLRTAQEIEAHHHSYLHSIKGSLEEAKSSVVYSYNKAINGFAAFLTPEEADTISEMDGVISVFKDESQELQTSRSWEFISLLESDWDPQKADGLEGLLRKAKHGKDIIVGVFDTGIWPESLSFNDSGMDPPPASWKGICQTGDEFTVSNCNRKVIGAQYYLKGSEAAYGPIDLATNYRSPRDSDGHGTHVASTIGGRRVSNASAVGGYGMGTVRGGADLAHLAVYKVCWVDRGCTVSDILAAFDDAISDGVHVFSVSIVPWSSTPLADQFSTIGALGAVKQNIVVAFSAGNSGPTPETVVNVAPYIISVGASSIDRVFSSPALLGNGYEAQGQSVSVFQQKSYEFVYAGDIEIPGSTNSTTTGECRPNTLSPVLAKGKAVFCLKGETWASSEVQRAGGVAAVLRNRYEGIGVNVDRHSIPTTDVLVNETTPILDYIHSSSTPTVTLNPATTLIGTKPAPFMTEFSSRGPVFSEPNILKPDITAPGLNILAAYTEAFSPNDKFVFLSGTSMSCPHVSGVAALLKAIHPSWSQAAIRSAIMTTGKITNNLGNTITTATLNPATPFEYGSGHIQPSKAADPGLVYDNTYDEYILFLCASIGYTLDPAYPCPSSGIPRQSNMNYPSLSIYNVQGVMDIPRRVTNVGNASATYSVTINQPAGYSVQISPSTLQFTAKGQTLGFTIKVQAQTGVVVNKYSFGSYTWRDGNHEVRSPIVLQTTSSPIVLWTNSSNIITNSTKDVALRASA